jgi:hypothetical protein
VDAVDALTEMTDQPTGGDVPTDEPPIHGTPTGPPDRAPAADRRRRGVLSGLAGVGLCVLWIMGIGVVVAQVVSVSGGRPGPGALAVGGHLAGAVVAVFCYRTVSRRRGLPRLLGLLALLAILVLLLWFYWWSPVR